MPADPESNKDIHGNGLRSRDWPRFPRSERAPHIFINFINIILLIIQSLGVKLGLESNSQRAKRTTGDHVIPGVSTMSRRALDAPPPCRKSRRP